MTDVSRAKTWCRNDCEHDYDNDFDSDCDYDHGCAHDDDVWLVMCLVNDMWLHDAKAFMFDPRHCINPQKKRFEAPNVHPMEKEK